VLSEVPGMDSAKIVTRQASGMCHIGHGKSEIKIRTTTNTTTGHSPWNNLQRAEIINGGMVNKAGTCRERKSNTTQATSQASRRRRSITWIGENERGICPISQE